MRKLALLLLLLMLASNATATYYADSIEALGYNGTFSGLHIGSSSTDTYLSTSPTGTGNATLYIGNARILTEGASLNPAGGWYDSGTAITLEDPNDNIDASTLYINNSDSTVVLNGDLFLGSNRLVFNDDWKAYPQDNTTFIITQGGTGGPELLLAGDGTSFDNANLSVGGELVWTTGDFSNTDITNWNTAYSWGNHATAGYDSDPADDFLNGYLNGRVLTDANNADNAGVTAYYLGTSALNDPAGTDHSLLTLSYSSSWSTQLAGDWRTNNWYVREQNNGAWGGWDLIYTSGNDPFDTEAELTAALDDNYFSTSGGTMNGDLYTTADIIKVNAGDRAYAALQPQPPIPSILTAGEIGISPTTYNDFDSNIAGERDYATACSGLMNYTQAIAFVEAVGARLPTLEEVEGQTVRGTGCSYDSQYVWTQTRSGPDAHFVSPGDPSYLSTMPRQSLSDSSTAYVSYVAEVDQGNLPAVTDSAGRLREDIIRARNTNGIRLEDDAGNLGLFIEDGGQVGIGTASPQAALGVNGAIRLAGSTTDTTLQQTGTHQFTIQGSDAKNRLQTSWNYARLFANGIERLDAHTSGVDITGALDVTGATTIAGDVGIGTASPTQKLEVVGGSGGEGIVLRDTGDTTNIGVLAHDGSNNARLILRDAAGNTQAFIDSAGASYVTGGDVGIGTTNPGGKLHINGASTTGTYANQAAGLEIDASGENTAAIQMNGATAPYRINIQDGHGRVHHLWNAYDSGSAHYYDVSGEGASWFEINGGSFDFLTAPSGTAGNAISWTSRLSMSSSGNVVVTVG